MSFLPVRIVGTGSYLPGPPIPNEEVEAILGTLDRAPRKTQSFVQNLGKRMLDRGGIQARHLAIDPDTGDLTHNFSSMAEIAGRSAMDVAGLEPQGIDLLLLSCPFCDQHCPPTSTLLQERLGIPSCAEMEIHSNCSGVGKSIQIAYDAMRCGRYRTALVCYSQLSSLYLRSCYFNQPKVEKVHAALRWILADGAGAVTLRAGNDGPDGHLVLGTFVESVGAGRPAGMKAGGATDLLPADHQFLQFYENGGHHLWQDFTAVNDMAAPLLLQGIVRMLEKLDVDSSTIDHYIVSIPTLQLYQDHIPAFLDELRITTDQIKFRSAPHGYVGGAATLVHLDEMARSGELQPGQTAVVHAVESSKWMTAGFAVRW
ncbi:MAG: 3-oxoacyl-ACP synthase III family protein [Phycisphaerae bacterium]|nr:3-oxoacyl-ACP synthase III family protein [Phycisphaerae bacterium]